MHVPFCSSKCAYCGFYSVSPVGWDVRGVVNSILKELDMVEPCEGWAKTIYIGGGSPSCIGSENLIYLAEQLVRRVGSVEEFTIEVNPSQVDAKTLAALRKIGVNRLSIGAQTFDKKLLGMLGRRCEPETIGKTVAAAKSSGFENISLDLIFAIPGQRLAGWLSDIEKAVSLSPTHISAYSLSFEENTPFYKLREEGKVAAVDEELDREMYYLTIDTLADVGFGQYEISNFARAGSECKHNHIYWANGAYVGIGPAAAASWYLGERRTNFADVKKYCGHIAEDKLPIQESHWPDNIEIACQSAVLGLRRIEGIDVAQYKSQTGFDLLKLFAYAIDSNVEKGFLVHEKGKVRLSRDALAIADSVLCDFADI